MWLAVMALSGALTMADAAYFAVPLHGADLHPLTVDASLTTALPRQTVETRDHETPARLEGVWLRDVLRHTGAPLGPKLSGKNMVLVVQLTAHDGYAVAFVLADFAPAFRDRPILLADRRDGEPLPENEAPLRLVAADEARFGRWIRQIARIELLDPSAGAASSPVEASSR